MPIERDFDLVIPDRAVLISDELPALYVAHLDTMGIRDHTKYDHYEINIGIKPKMPEVEDDRQTWMKKLASYSRKRKRRSFVTADKMRIGLEVGHNDILIRAMFPPTTFEDGSTEFNLGAFAEIIGGVKLPGVSASTKLQADIQRKFNPKTVLIRTHKGTSYAIWEFQRPWITQGSGQPDVKISCIVAKDMDDKYRHVKCQRSVYHGGRAILAPADKKKIILPKGPAKSGS